MRMPIQPRQDSPRVPSPDEVLLSFLQSTYEAAAQGLNWEREQLERQPTTVVVDGAPSTA